jgi:hypothetical protein
MLKNFLMAAGLATAFSLSAQVAEAKVDVTIGIGQPGGYCYYNYDPFRCGGYGFIHAQGILSPIRSSGIAYPAGKRSGCCGTAAIATLLRRIAGAVPIHPSPGSAVESSGSGSIPIMAESHPFVRFELIT